MNVVKAWPTSNVDTMDSSRNPVKWTLRIETATPSQNTRDHQHPMVRHKEKGVWWWWIRAAKGFLDVPKATCRRRLTIERHARTVPQDEANVHGGCKGIVDDLVQLGLLVDDSPQWIMHTPPRHVKIKKGEKPYTILILEDEPLVDSADPSEYACHEDYAAVNFGGGNG